MWNLLTLNWRWFPIFCNIRKNGLFYKCFYEVFVKNLTEKVPHLNTKFQDSFQHVCIIASSCLFIFKVWCIFCFCHHSLFDVSLLYLFINVFTRYLSKTWWKRCHMLRHNSNIQSSMYVSLNHHVFLYLTFMYLLYT